MNKYIKSFAPTILSAQELVAISGRLCRIAAEHAPDDKVVNEYVEQVKASVLCLEKALQSPRGNALTKDLASNDAARCSALANLSGFLAGMSCLESRPQSKQSAAFLLRIVRGERARIDRISYARRSGAICMILSSLNKPEAKSCIVNLQIQDLVSALATAQNAFEQTYRKRITAGAKRDPSLTIRGQRPETAYYLTGLLSYVDACHNRISSFPPMVAELNGAISDVMGKARARRTRRRSAASK